MAVPDDIRARKRPTSRLKSSSKKAAPQKARRGLTSTTVQDIRVIVIALRFIQASTIVAVAALQKQNADLDIDIALALQHGAINPLATQVEKLAALLGDSEEAIC
jgi:hypothetical protein